MEIPHFPFLGLKQAEEEAGGPGLEVLEAVAVKPIIAC